MKKIMMIFSCVLVCFSLFTGCTDQKDGHDQDTNVGNSVEFDDTDALPPGIRLCHKCRPAAR